MSYYDARTLNYIGIRISRLASFRKGIMSLAQPLGDRQTAVGQRHSSYTLAYPKRLNVCSQFLPGLNEEKSHSELSG